MNVELELITYRYNKLFISFLGLFLFLGNNLQAKFQIQECKNSSYQVKVCNELLYPVAIMVVVDKTDSKINRRGVGPRRVDSSGRVIRDSLVLDQSSIEYSLKNRIPKDQLKFIVVLDSTDMIDTDAQYSRNPLKGNFGVKIALGPYGIIAGRTGTSQEDYKFNIPHHFEFYKSRYYSSSYEAVVHFKGIDSARKTIAKQIVEKKISDKTCGIEGPSLTCGFGDKELHLSDNAYNYEKEKVLDGFSESFLNQLSNSPELIPLIDIEVLKFFSDLDPTVKHPGG